MPVIPNTIFPCFDINDPFKVMEIPDNITRSFGAYNFTFIKAGKTARVSVDESEWCYNGDYGVYINGVMVKDKKLISWLTKINNPKVNAFIRKELNNICQITIEQVAYDTIVQYTDQINSDPELKPHIDLIQATLYYSWHRCQIEDRLYPPQIKNYEGRKKYLTEIKSNLY